MTLQLDYSFWIILLGSTFMSLTAGALGAFAFLRRQSMLGDTISHAALPGVVLAFLFFLEKNSLAMFLGAVLTSLASLLFLQLILTRTPLKADAALGIVLSVFFGFGIMLLTVAQQLPFSSQAGLTNFLFGNATALLFQDLLLIGALSLFALGSLIFFWKEFTLLSFDKPFAASLGWSLLPLELFLGLLLIVAIVIGLESVGIVLMSALLVTPAAIAAQWTNRMLPFVLSAALTAFFCSTAAVVISSLSTKLPTGPISVSLLSLVLLFSFCFSPKRGFFFRLSRKIKLFLSSRA